MDCPYARKADRSSNAGTFAPNGVFCIRSLPGVSGSSRFPRSKVVRVEESRAVVDGEDVDTIVTDAVNDSIASP